MKPNWKPATRSILAGVSLYLAAASASYAGGSVCMVADPVWRAGHTTAQTALSTAVDNMAATFANQSLLTHEALIGALRVNTRQKSLSGEQVSVSGMHNTEAAANVYVEQRASERIREAHQTYGPQGQMVGGCELTEQLQLADDAMEAASSRASDVLAGDAIDAAPGQSVPPLKAAGRRLNADVPEAVSAVAFFDPDTSSAHRDAFMNNVIGLPFVQPEGIDNVSDDITFMQARRWEAMRSPAIVSLAFTRASAEAGSHFGVGAEASETSSYLSAVDYLIEQFGGGPAYEKWSASIVTKSETGLLKEIARLRAINLRLSSFRQGSQDRQQAVIATLLAGEAVR